MRLETVQGDPKAWDMEDVVDKKTLAVERNNRCSMTQDRSNRIVTHADAEAVNGLVGNEGTTVGDHVVVSGASVCYHETE
jgi:hypothetical protein